MPKDKDFKRLVRERMTQTGERYTQALTQLQAETPLTPLPAPWFRTGNRAMDYEAGLLPAEHQYEGMPIVRLRARPEVPEFTGFGAFMQSITAIRYLGSRVRFSAMLRTVEVDGWGGLWLRVDSAVRQLVLDNMQDRALRGSTEWTPADIVLDVAPEAASLHFGALLSGSGALDLACLRFEVAGEEVPTTNHPISDEPVNLDFGAA